LGDWALYALAVKIGIIAGLVIYLPLFLQRRAVLREVTRPVVTEQGTIKTIGITDTPTIDAPEGQTVSRTSTEGVMIQFANQAREPVLIYWVDFNGNEIKYGRIEPGERIALNSFSGHLWVVKTTSGKVLLRYAVNPSYSPEGA
jgi:VHL beta domain